MKVKMTPVAAAVSIALLSTGAAVHAQDAAQPPAASASAPTAKKADALDTVVVTGIRASTEKALSIKRNAESHVEVITAEDIGKMPDKNIADSLQRVPGVTTSSSGGNEGGFGENDRVSMRGTGPSLTQTLINGHNVASGDWFVLSQTSTVGRSVSYTLLPSELVSQIVVHKTSEASLVEGGVSGSIDIITRKPLEFSKPFTAEVSVGASYADLAGKTDPQFNALFNWRNAEKTGGVMLQLFDEKRELRRDGQEILGYDQITAGSAPNIVAAHPDLNGVWAPHLIGSTYFTQTRDRKGGLLDGEIKPTADLTLEAQGFYSLLNATNYNRNYMEWGATHLDQSPSAYTVGTAGGVSTLTSATFAATPGTNYGVYDQISRPDESATTSYLTLEAKYTPTDRLKLNAQLGASKGDGKTPRQDIAEWNEGAGSGSNFALNGAGSPANWGLGASSSAAGPGTGGTTLGWVFGDENIDVKDMENWLKLDGEYALDGAGPWVALKFGARANVHSRSLWGVVGQGPACFNSAHQNQGFNWSQANWCSPGLTSANDPAQWPAVAGYYPSNFASGLGGSFPTNIWYASPAALAAFNAATANDATYTPPGGVATSREDINSEYTIKETTQAAYLQGDLEGKGWSGNVGLRLVRTTENVQSPMIVDASTPGANLNNDFIPGQGWIVNTTRHTYTDLLPSFNLKLELSKDQLLRLAASRTMTRPDYSALSGTISLGAPPAAGGIGGGSGGNPDLKPIISDNVDLAWEFYYAPRAMFSASVFMMDLRSNVSYGSKVGTYFQSSTAFPQGAYQTYNLTMPINTTGSVQGLELAIEQPLGKYFGVSANYTYTDAYENDPSGSSQGTVQGPMVGASRNVANLGGYYEDDRFNVRVNYSYRSAFYSGLDRSTAFFQGNTGTVSASLGYKISENLAVSLDGLNLNNPELKYYATPQQPRAFYLNGRQYYLALHAKF